MERTILPISIEAGLDYQSFSQQQCGIRSEALRTCSEIEREIDKLIARFEACKDTFIKVYQELSVRMTNYRRYEHYCLQLEDNELDIRDRLSLLRQTKRAPKRSQIEAAMNVIEKFGTAEQQRGEYSQKQLLQEASTLLRETVLPRRQEQRRTVAAERDRLIQPLKDLHAIYDTWSLLATETVQQPRPFRLLSILTERTMPDCYGIKGKRTVKSPRKITQDEKVINTLLSQRSVLFTYDLILRSCLNTLRNEQSSVIATQKGYALGIAKDKLVDAREAFSQTVGKERILSPLAKTLAQLHFIYEQRQEHNGAEGDARALINALDQSSEEEVQGAISELLTQNVIELDSLVQRLQMIPAVWNACREVAKDMPKK